MEGWAARGEEERPGRLWGRPDPQCYVRKGERLKSLG